MERLDKSERIIYALRMLITGGRKGAAECGEVEGEVKRRQRGVKRLSE